MIVEIYGTASQTRKNLYIPEPVAFDHLLALLHSNQIPVASSCSGVGICGKCVLWVNGEKKLSCQFPLQNSNNDIQIEINYL